jgi:hypothetical protein
MLQFDDATNGEGSDYPEANGHQQALDLSGWDFKYYFHDI